MIGLSEYYSCIKLEKEKQSEKIKSNEKEVMEVLLRTFNLLRAKKEIENNNRDIRVLNCIKKELPSGIKNLLDILDSDLEMLDYINKLLKGCEISDSADFGGHGGTSKASILLDDGSKIYLFLKPKDKIEQTNYKIIEMLDPKIAKYMPKIYGEIQISGRTYVVMENVRFSAEGFSLRQLVDIKLAGNIQGLDNPIADQKEMVATRAKKKGWFDYFQMRLGAYVAPGYMIASGLVRIFNYKKSNEKLLIELKNVSEENINSLLKKLNNIKILIEENNAFALIGSSIILIQNTDGSITPLLIDPAHMVVHESQKNKLDDKLSVYYNSSRFYLQKKSNIKAINNLICSINEILSMNRIPKK